MDFMKYFLAINATVTASVLYMVHIQCSMGYIAMSGSNAALVNFSTHSLGKLLMALANTLHPSILYPFITRSAAVAEIADRTPVITTTTILYH